MTQWIRFEGGIGIRIMAVITPDTHSSPLNALQQIAVHSHMHRIVSDHPSLIRGFTPSLLLLPSSSSSSRQHKILQSLIHSCDLFTPSYDYLRSFFCYLLSYQPPSSHITPLSYSSSSLSSFIPQISLTPAAFTLILLPLS